MTDVDKEVTQRERIMRMETKIDAIDNRLEKMENNIVKYFECKADKTEVNNLKQKYNKILWFTITTLGAITGFFLKVFLEYIV